MHEPSIRYWRVQINYEPEDYKGHRANRLIGVIAEDLEAAISKVKNEFPDCKIVSASHNGPVDIT